MNLILLWLLTSWTGSAWVRQECNGSFAVQARPVCAVMVTERCGDISGAYLQFTIQVDGNSPQFTSRGQGLWNNCASTNFVRLFFTDRTNVYSNISSSLNPNHYWWSTSRFYVDPARWSLGWPNTLCANVYPWEWTNGIGHNGNLDPAAFYDCAANATQAGLSFGFCSFDDTGITLAGGSATISVAE